MTRSSYTSFLLPLLLPTLAAGSSLLPQCQFPAEGEVAKYHMDNTCDRHFQNSPEHRARIVRRNQELHQSPTGVQQVPNEKTVTCPLPGTTTSLYPASNGEAGDIFGLHTTWLVENTSKLPVVVAFVDPATGQEYSAINSKISPPHADPQAILMQGQWTSIWTMEGHVFHVYELLGEAGNYHLGRLVLQHRVGLIPVENKFASPEDIQCEDASAIVDVPPIEEETEEVHADFQRDPSLEFERCNVLYRGFRNMVGCPVHAYYTGLSLPPASGQMECAEDFKFHLGIDGQASDFENDWEATTKFETTFISHTYVFRLASNPSIMVDAHTFTPTHVVDCPGQESVAPLQQRQVSEAVAEQVVLPYGDKTNTDTVLIDPKMILTLLTPPNSTSQLDHIISGSRNSTFYRASGSHEHHATSACKVYSAAATASMAI